MTDPTPSPPARRMEPPISALSGPFWEATRQQRLLLQWCLDCGRPIFYPREACPRCLGENFEWRQASGEGRVYAVSVQYRPAMRLPVYTDGPYVVALIELPEGVRMMSNVVGCPPDDVTIGMAVSVAWEPLSDGRNLPQFRLGSRAPDPPAG